MSYKRVDRARYLAAGNIKRNRDRLVALERAAERSARAEASGGVLVTHHGDYVKVTFAEKPAVEVRAELKAAGFWFAGGSWAGRADALPERYRS